MNELTEFGAENNALARRYGSQSPLVFTMASDAFPIVHAGFRDMDPELLAIRGDAMRASVQGSAAAVAARFSAVGLANPISSGVIAVVEALEIVVAAAPHEFFLFKQGLAVSALQGSTQGVPLDSRQTERASVRLLATDEAAVANYGTSFWRRRIDVLSASSPVFLPPMVLGPASTMWVVLNTVNVAFACSFQWRQRRIVSQEASS